MFLLLLTWFLHYYGKFTGKLSRICKTSMVKLRKRPTLDLKTTRELRYEASTVVYGGVVGVISRRQERIFQEDVGHIWVFAVIWVFEHDAGVQI